MKKKINYIKMKGGVGIKSIAEMGFGKLENPEKK